MVGNLKYWNNGEPTLPNEGLGGLKYWINGEAYVVYTTGEEPPVTPTVFMTTNTKWF